jgi:hypothetical protein
MAVGFQSVDFSALTLDFKDRSHSEFFIAIFVHERFHSGTKLDIDFIHEDETSFVIWNLLILGIIREGC